MNILEEANKIVNLRSEEKERMYGPFEEGMDRAAMIASGMTGKDIDAKDVYAIMVALKLSRHSYSYKEDNLLDAAAYIGSLNNYIENSLKQNKMVKYEIEEENYKTIKIQGDKITKEIETETYKTIKL